MNNQIINIVIIIRFIVLLLSQLLLNRTLLFGYLNPQIYVLFIILYPIKKDRFWLIFSSFLLGLTIDIFSNSGGINAAASTFIAFISPFLIQLLSNRLDSSENLVQIHQLSLYKKIIHISALIIIHTFILYSLEYFGFKNLGDMLIKIIFNSCFTTFVVLTSYYLFAKKP